MSYYNTPSRKAANASIVRHNTYFFDDTLVEFLVENTLFKVHRFFFKRDSPVFRELFASAPLGTPILLPIAPFEFELLLDVLYPRSFDRTNLSTDQWITVLRLASMWKMDSLRHLAIQKVDNGLLDPVDKAVLATQCGVQEWYRSSFEALCTRPESISLVEGRKLGLDTVVALARAREDVRAERCDPREAVTEILASSLAALFLSRENTLVPSPISQSQSFNYGDQGQYGGEGGGPPAFYDIPLLPHHGTPKWTYSPVGIASPDFYSATNGSPNPLPLTFPNVNGDLPDSRQSSRSQSPAATLPFPASSAAHYNHLQMQSPVQRSRSFTRSTAGGQPQKLRSRQTTPSRTHLHNRSQPIIDGETFPTSSPPLPPNARAWIPSPQLGASQSAGGATDLPTNIPDDFDLKKHRRVRKQPARNLVLSTMAVMDESEGSPSSPYFS